MDNHPQEPDARAARSHGAIEPEHGATSGEPQTTSQPGEPQAESRPGVGRRVPAKVLWPVIAALGLGCYALWIDHTSGAKGGQAALVGLVTAVVSGTLGLLLVHYQSTMITEIRALLYGALFGTSMGWLYNLSGPSVLKSSTWGLVMGSIMFAVSLYMFRAKRTKEPHGLHRPRRAHRLRIPRRPHGAH
ncbi:hypothetical protein [Streptomyces halobius]|uniref:Membrane protein (TIGR04086 family) n=1 Tax=Streptomyces halobius TaxID=2879846 RepID=A0ABY4MC15_9ACTN|nr:hypothetical protein [Streptomyces halobius]UQA94862.1 hypothetical protein K9S39_26080 [Streptomyces halobius]